MPSQIREVVRYLHSTVLRQAEAGLTDGQLLGRFIEHRDKAAVEALVGRHGPMVWGVCSRVLPNHHDAEDAFQATFLVLVRRAGSVRPREMVGNWLYGVAHQTALKARAMLAKRRTKERQVTDVPETAAPQQDVWRDLHAVLDQELSRLPDKYRVAIVLCDMEGTTRKEAARRLGVPEGTLAGRLTRGRALLAKRLARYGLAVSGGALAAVLSQQAASASVPTSVLCSTIQAVTSVAAGQAAAGVVSAKVAALSEGVVKAMLLTKLKTTTAGSLALSLIVFGGGMLAQHTTGQEVKAEKEPAAKQQADRGPPATGAAPQKVASFEDFNGRIVDLVDNDPNDLFATQSRKSIMFRFDMDERSYLRYQRLLAAKKVKGSGDPLAVRLLDEANFDRVGALVRFEHKFNTATGTIGVYGVLPNAEGLLRPGMFVRVRVAFGPAVTPQTDEADAKDKLQGSWHLIALEQQGKQALIASRRLTISADKVLVVEDPLGTWPQGARTEFRYVVRPTTDPKQLDLIHTFGVKEGKIIKGIYRLEGERLFLCLNHADSGERPAKFVAEAGTKVELMLLERDKKDTQPPKRNSAEELASKNKAIVKEMEAINKRTSAAAADFEYPGAKRLDQRDGNAGLTYAGSIYQSLCSTTDDLSKVAKWYDKKLAGLIAGQPAGVTGEGGEEDRTRRAINQDGERPDLDALAKRPVSTRSYLIRTKSHTVSVVISRPPDEALTVISLTYMPE